MPYACTKCLTHALNVTKDLANSPICIDMRRYTMLKDVLITCVMSVTNDIYIRLIYANISNRLTRENSLQVSPLELWKRWRRDERNKHSVMSTMSVHSAVRSFTTG